MPSPRVFSGSPHPSTGDAPAARRCEHNSHGRRTTALAGHERCLPKTFPNGFSKPAGPDVQSPQVTVRRVQTPAPPWGPHAHGAGTTFAAGFHFTPEPVLAFSLQNLPAPLDSVVKQLLLASFLGTDGSCVKAHRPIYRAPLVALVKLITCETNENLAFRVWNHVPKPDNDTSGCPRCSGSTRGSWSCSTQANLQEPMAGNPLAGTEREIKEIQMCNMYLTE